MSQYINQMNCDIREVVRLQFNEVVTDDQPPIFTTIVCMHYEFLKAIHEVIGKSIEQHEEQLKNISTNLKLS